MATATNDSIQGFDGTPTAVCSESTGNLASDDILGGQTIFNNTSDLWTIGIATLFCTGFGGDPSTGTVDLYLMKGDVGDGTENEDAGTIQYADSIAAGDTQALTPGLHYVGSFDFDTDTGAQRKAINISLVGVKEAYFYIDNQTGQSITQPISVDVEGFTFTPRT